MKVYRGHRWSHQRVEVTRWLDIEFDLTQIPLPRIRLWPDERGVLVGLSLGDTTSDPVVGVDLRVDGRVGRRWADWLWKRRR